MRKKLLVILSALAAILLGGFVGIPYYLEITAKHPSQKEAARIANTVAEAYIKQRQRIQTERAHNALEALEALDEEIQIQVSLVTNQKAKVDESRNEQGINEAEDMLREMMIKQDMLREMMIKHQEARIFLKVPRNPITIHERAK